MNSAQSGSTARFLTVGSQAMNYLLLASPNFSLKDCTIILKRGLQILPHDTDIGMGLY